MNAPTASQGRVARNVAMISSSLFRQLLPALLSVSVPDSTLPIPSMESYLLHPCSRASMQSYESAPLVCPQCGADMRIIALTYRDVLMAREARLQGRRW
jgi:hypothetical protein